MSRLDWTRISCTPIRVDRAPQPLHPALYADDNFIKMPFVSWRRSIPPNLGRKLVPETTNPITDRFVRHRDAALGQEIFHVAKAQSKPMVGPNRVSDGAPWKSEALDPGKIAEVQHDRMLPGRKCASNLTKPVVG